MSDDKRPDLSVDHAFLNELVTPLMVAISMVESLQKAGEDPWRSLINPRQRMDRALEALGRLEEKIRIKREQLLKQSPLDRPKMNV